MARFLARRLGEGMIPIDDIGREAIRRVPMNATVSVEVKRPRNPEHHRKLFALLSLIYQNQTLYSTVEDLLDAIKIHVGHAKALKLRDGTAVMVPKSISFSTTDQTAFEEFYSKVIDCVVTEIIPGLDKADLERELMEFAA